MNADEIRGKTKDWAEKVKAMMDSGDKDSLQVAEHSGRVLQTILLAEIAAQLAEFSENFGAVLDGALPFKVKQL